MDCFHQLVFDFRFEKELKKGGGGRIRIISERD